MPRSATACACGSLPLRVRLSDAPAPAIAARSVSAPAASAARARRHLGAVQFLRETHRHDASPHEGDRTDVRVGTVPAPEQRAVERRVHAARLRITQIRLHAVHYGGDGHARREPIDGAREAFARIPLQDVAREVRPDGPSLPCS